MSDASTEIIIKSLKILARDIQSDDGVANLALLEAADCLKRIVRERDEALSQIFQAECRAERFCQERDEARKEAECYKKRYEQIKDERDEATEKLKI